MARLGTYDFKKSTIVLGLNQITGFAEGDSVEIEEAEDVFKYATGVGSSDRVMNNNNYLKIKIKLTQSSPSNQVLSAIHLADRAGGVPLPFSFTYVDKNSIGKDVSIGGTTAWIIKFPTIRRGNNTTEHEWMLQTDGDYVINIGGL